MKYTINDLSKIAGISARTLRYYDQIDLLKPNYINQSNYRIYTSKEVDFLQQILFFKELGLPLKEIKEILSSSNFDKLDSLKSHYESVKEKQKQLDSLLNNILKTIANLKGETNMNDQEKFQGLKDKVIQENTEKYGKELKEKYGSEYIEKANMKYKKLSKYQVKEQTDLSSKINKLLVDAVTCNDTSNNLSMELCRTHQLWIQSYWPTYSKEAHMELVETYLQDERFKAYYEKIIKGGAVFLRDSMKIYLNL